jgi:hypothetical protein
VIPRTAGDDPDDADDEPYRLVIVDCPPSLGQLTRSALAAAHRAVLITDPTMFAVSGVQRAFDAVQTERQRGNPDLQPLGVLINRVRPRNTEHEFRIAELRELFGPLVLSGVLPDRSAIQQAQGACLPIQRWDTPGAREVSAVFTDAPRPRAAGRPAPPAGGRPTRGLLTPAPPAEDRGEWHVMPVATGVRCLSRRSRQERGAQRPSTSSVTSSRNCSDWRSRSSASRVLTSRSMPASAAARVSEQEAK